MSRFEKLMKLLITRGEGPVEYDVDSDYSSYWSLEGGKITCHVSGKIIDLHDPKNEAEKIFNYCVGREVCTCCPLVNFGEWNCEHGENMLMAK
jgi:hypothetical protein